MSNNVKIITTSSFKRNLKRFKKKHYDLSRLESIIHSLIANNTNDLKHHKDHALVGKYKGFRELHIEPDWLLVYRFENNNLELLLVDTGTHDDLFK